MSEYLQLCILVTIIHIYSMSIGFNMKLHTYSLVVRFFLIREIVLAYTIFKIIKNHEFDNIDRLKI